MRHYKTIESTKEYIEEMYCNKCGDSIQVTNGIVAQGVYQGDSVWGYFSNKDGVKHSFDICEKCYDKMVNEFVIPIKIEEI